MDFSGMQTIAVPLEKVWIYLMDVNNVARCTPGFQSLETVGDEHWKAVISVGVGPVKATFILDVRRPEKQEPDLMVVKAHGKAPGSAVDLTGRMKLSPVKEQETRLEWTAQVIVSGAMASVGAHLLKGVAHKLADQFFACLSIHLQAP